MIDNWSRFYVGQGNNILWWTVEQNFMIDSWTTFYDRQAEQHFMLDRGTTFYVGQGQKLKKITLSSIAGKQYLIMEASDLVCMFFSIYC
jgi:hypothetical protein